ncbi:MAG TPA: hypothetical protein VL092_09515 [Chitinophagaceae bacterium]|nr:hypothetical protein [Chitinophagaceae bacterium]
MKRLFQTLCLSVLPALSFAHTHGEYLGLIAHLNHIKMCSENMVSSLLNDSNNSPEFKGRVVDQYNELRAQSDQIILQLEADSRSKKGLCYYNKLDKMLTNKSMKEIKKDYYDKGHCYHSAKTEGYVWNLILLEKKHHKLAKLKNEAYSKGDMYCLAAAAGAHKDGDARMFAAVNDISSNRERKVERITMMLDDQRLCPVQKLVKKVKKERTEKVEHIVKIEKMPSVTAMGSHLVKYKKTKKVCKCK